ncbi:MAG: ATP-binding cassette domain-containing protein [Betaproteobacteria bacterium]|nr:ATP-binding cassette domain-containing protein [Betaproteobacteria bacterium]
MNSSAIYLNNISYHIDGKTIFDNFNYTFPYNSITPLIGKSGSGKTTLIRIASGLLNPSDGKVIFETFISPLTNPVNGSNRENDQNKETNLRKVQVEIKNPSREIMVMNQTYTSFPWMNCLENVLVHHRFLDQRHTKENEQEALAILKEVGLDDYAYKMPSDLSGGMKQRLALARVLYVKAPVVMMDEPLSALDKVTRTEMQRLLLQHQEQTKCTMVIITHDNEEAEILRRNSSILNLTPGGS